MLYGNLNAAFTSSNQISEPTFQLLVCICRVLVKDKTTPVNA